MSRTDKKSNSEKAIGLFWQKNSQNGWGLLDRRVDLRCDGAVVGQVLRGFLAGLNDSEWWPSQSWASAAVMIQQIIRVFDGPSCPPHLCTQMVRLLASINGQHSHISP